MQTTSNKNSETEGENGLWTHFSGPGIKRRVVKAAAKRSVHPCVHQHSQGPSPRPSHSPRAHHTGAGPCLPYAVLGVPAAAPASAQLQLQHGIHLSDSQGIPARQRGARFRGAAGTSPAPLHARPASPANATFILPALGLKWSFINFFCLS